jgi:cell division protein FtsA
MPGPAPHQVRQVARELIAHVAEQRLDEILGLVRQDLHESGLMDRIGAGVVMTGGGAAMPGLVELAQQIFPAPVRLGVPGEGLAGLADSVGRPRFATAVGLALHGLERFAETGEGASTVGSGVLTRVGSWLKEFF